jgi:hypothetical protein
MSPLSISPSVPLSALFSELVGGTSPASSPGSLADAAAKALMAEVDGGTTLSAHPLDAGGRGSLGEALAQGRTNATAFDTFGHATGPSALQALAAAEGRPAHSPTLQDMAQAVPRHDIAAERHGSATEGTGTLQGAPSPVAADAGPAADKPIVSSSSSRPEAAGTDAVARGEAQLTQAPLSMLHLQNTEFRTRFSEPPVDDEDDARQGRRDAQHPEDEDDTPAGTTALPQDAAALVAAGLLSPAAGRADEKAAGPTDAPSPAPAGSSLGDPQLYQQIVSALHAVGAAPASPVSEALEELRRQRRVVLATPSGLTAGLRCAAHVDVLWPVPGGGGRALRLSGELLWAQASAEADWMMAHLVKSQADGNVRQLAPIAADADARRIAVCLGAQAVPMVAWSQACLRVRDATRLWQALEPQWSLRLLVSTLPLSLLQNGGAPLHPPGRPHHGA